MRQLFRSVLVLTMVSAIAACGGDETPDTNPERDSGPSLDAGSDTNRPQDTDSDAADTTSDGDAGSDAEPDSTSYPDDISFESYTEALIGFLLETECTRAWECPTPPRNHSSSLGRRFESVEACRSTLKDSQFFQTLVREELEPTKRLIEAGRVGYDSQQAADCLDQYASLTVAQTCGPNPSAFLTACYEPAPITGTIGPGGDCIDQAECADGYCPTGQTCNGTCRLSGGCGDGAACLDGEYCARQPDDTFSCEALKPQGQSCESSECQEDLYCPMTGASRTCQVRKSAGSVCNRAEECEDPYTCIRDAEGRNGTCNPAKSEGETCYRSEECGGEMNCMRLDSETVGVCAGDGDRQRGESCSRSSYCSADDTCVNETCVKLEYVSQGSRCTNETHCTPGTICQLASPDATMGACRPPAQRGDSCVATNDCTYGLYCDGASDSQAGNCAPVKDDGAGCSESSECTSGLCRDSICGGPAEVCPIP